MVVLNTLKIRHLPKNLSNSEKEEFMKHFGATTVKVLTSNYKQTSVVYAKFESSEIAKNVMLRLHQMLILNSRLSVEYAEHEIGIGPPKCDKSGYSEETFNNEHLKAFINKISSWNNSIPFQQPPPAHLKYKYPKPNTATINNIAHALASVPKFYIQVLHLMNKMNLPPPFSNIPDPPHLRKRIKTEESSESELESDTEINSTQNHSVIPQKNPLNKVNKRPIKRPKFIKPPPTPTITLKKDSNHISEEVFEKVDLHNKKTIEFSVSTESLESRNKNNDAQINEIGTFGILQPKVDEIVAPQASEENEKENEENKIITENELNSNRISPKEIEILPIFKNYHPGPPTCRLYIKNLAKNVGLKDLEYVYHRYKETDASSEQSMFDIKLLQEGRMKGQAFVTLDNVEIAKKAVSETNGFILKTKPLVVVFARSAVPKK